MKNYIFKFKLFLKQIFQSNLSFQKDSFLHKNVPYSSQWESKNLVKDIIEKKISAQNDPLWKKSGAKTKEEYQIWSWNSCGMACLKMILAYKLRKNFSIVELGKECKKYGGYRGKNLDGLYYQPFLKFIRKKFNLSAKIISPMTTKDIVKELENKNFVIASVSYEIRNPTNKPSFKGGHLVLVLGYDRQKQTFFIHNPSGIDKKTQEYAKISFSDFNKQFAYKGITILNK